MIPWHYSKFQATLGFMRPHRYNKNLTVSLKFLGQRNAITAALRGPSLNSTPSQEGPESCVPHPQGQYWLPASPVTLEGCYLPTLSPVCPLAVPHKGCFLLPMASPRYRSLPLFIGWCIVTHFDLLLFEPDTACLVAFNPPKD